VHITRRSLLKAPCVAVLAGVVQQAGGSTGPRTMYGLIGKMKAAAGQREALIRILLEGTRDMPGCLSYIVARDPSDPDGIWITEVWDSRESHAASLTLPAVQEAISRGRPLIAGFGERFETEPVGGAGLPG